MISASPQHTRCSSLLFGAALGLLSACQPIDGTSAPSALDRFDRATLVRRYVDDMLLPALTQFEQASVVLEEKTVTYAGALEEDGDAANAKSEAQQAWRDAMAVWQTIEMMQVGPLGMPGVMMAGEGMRDEIYSWPTVNPCAIDQQLVAHGFSEDGYFTQKLVTLSGLDALEYVLFTTSSDNACPAPATINAQGEWAALSTEEVTRRRAGYAAALARDLRQKAERLRARYTTEGSGFRTALLEPGTAGSPYDSFAEVVDQIFAAMFYLELQVKDRKLAVPLGLHIDCASTSCPEQIESRASRRSMQNIRENLQAFQQIFSGDRADDSGLGFADYLREVGADDLATTMSQNVDSALDLFTTSDVDLETLLTSDRARAEALHAAIKTITENIKSQMISVLNLEVPLEGAGDND